MQRIDGATASPGLSPPAPTSGTPGYFTNGNPATATPPTIVSQDWLNMIQEEIVAVVQAGGLSLDKANWTQVRDSIKNIINSIVSGSYLKLSGGTLSGDLTFDAAAGRNIRFLQCGIRIYTTSDTIGISDDADGLNVFSYSKSGDILQFAAPANFNGSLQRGGKDVVTSDQLSAAINALVNGAPGALDQLNELAAALGNDPNFRTTILNLLAGKVATSRQVGTGGLATGGGDLTQDRTISVPAAAVSDVLAGSDGGKAVTPAALAGAIGDGTSGYVRLPGGVILQWGEIALTDGSGYKDVVFPIPFPNACFNVVASNDSGDGSGGGAVAWASCGLLSKTGFRCSMTIASKTAAGSGTASFWQAIGR